MPMRTYKRQWLTAVKAVAALFIVSALPFSAAKASEDKLQVFVSVAPQKYLLQKVAGDLIDADLLVQPGHNPHSYDPSARQMGRLAKADMLMTTGVPFEQVWLPRIRQLNPELILVDTLQGITEISDEHHGHEHHEEVGHNAHHDDDHTVDRQYKHDSHEADHDRNSPDGHHGHQHDGLDPHIWMDPLQALQQARIMTQALQKQLPEAEQQLEQNYQALSQELTALDHELHEQLHAYEGRTFMVFHPAWGHFAKRYQLEQVAIEYQGKSPSARQLVQLSDKALAEKIKVILVQEQFNRKPAERIAANIDARVVAADPLPEDLPKALRALTEQLLESWH